MKHLSYITIIGVALLLLASCGQQQRAKSVVKDFVQTQLHEDASYIDFADVDSTHVLNDSIIQAMRSRAAKNIQYQNYQGRTLMHIRVQYLLDKDTCSATFYLDKDMTGVVAFKRN
jgi:hypothetical protein